MPERIDFKTYFVKLACLAAQRSEDPFNKAGCIIANKQKEILSTGYNGVKRNTVPPKEFYERENPFRKLITFHAEENALRIASKSHSQMLYMAINFSPCKTCAKLIAAYDIQEVYFPKLYKREQDFKQIFKFYHIKWEIINEKK